MHRAFKSSTLAVGILFVLISAAASRAQDHPISVFVFSDVRVRPAVFEPAMETASRIFSQAGIDVAWIKCLHAPGGDPNSGCEKIYGSGDLVLRITSHVSTATSDAAFGVAWLADDGTGRYADIFWARAQELHILSDTDLGKILGSVMAHEIGHLLLGANSHSVAGLMRARWGSNELQAISAGTLLFLPQESKKMRTQVAIAVVAHPSAVIHRAFVTSVTDFEGTPRLGWHVSR